MRETANKANKADGTIPPMVCSLVRRVSRPLADRCGFTSLLRYLAVERWGRTHVDRSCLRTCLPYLVRPLELLQLDLGDERFRAGHPIVSEQGYDVLALGMPPQPPEGSLDSSPTTEMLARVFGHWLLGALTGGEVGCQQVRQGS